MTVRKTVALDAEGNLLSHTTETGFVFGAATVNRVHGSRAGSDKGRVWMEIETPKERVEIHVSATGKVRIWSHRLEREVTK